MSEIRQPLLDLEDSTKVEEKSTFLQCSYGNDYVDVLGKTNICFASDEDNFGTKLALRLIALLLLLVNVTM